MTMKFFGREPAAVLALLAASLQLAALTIPGLTDEVQAGINGLAVAAVGLVTAWVVKRDHLLPAVLGVGGGVFTLLASLAIDVPMDTQTKILSFVTVAFGLFVRSQVTAPVGPVESRSPLAG